MEYLLGRLMHNALLNLGALDQANAALAGLGLSLSEIEQREHDAGLGNGGLGRLAACFLDSSATLGLPVIGYGLRYQYGMFRQCVRNGNQVEEPDNWLRDGHPWEIERPELAQRIHFGGRSEFTGDATGNTRARWVDTHDVLAVPFDIPVPGYRNGVVNTLRLWSAQATDEFDLAEFNAGSYPEAVRAKNAAENVTMVLYPNVEILNAAGVEVVLDVVYNHTAEGSHLGPTLSFRGIDNQTYYRLTPEAPRYYVDWTGCGNTLNLTHPLVRGLVLDSLRYWAAEMEVDGFRFDLATTVGRGDHDFDAQGAFFREVANDPVLKDLKLIAEPWDLGPATERGLAFRAFQASEGAVLRKFALFEAMAAQGSQSTPPSSPAVGQFEAAHEAELEYYEYLQWQTRIQLAACAACCHEAGMRIGLYQDLAIGADSAGADVWATPTLYADGVNLGAPPDDFAPNGQALGLSPWIPDRLRSAGYDPFIRCLRANMQHRSRGRTSAPILGAEHARRAGGRVRRDRA